MSFSYAEYFYCMFFHRVKELANQWMHLLTLVNRTDMFILGSDSEGDALHKTHH